MGNDGQSRKGGRSGGRGKKFGGTGQGVARELRHREEERNSLREQGGQPQAGRNGIEGRGGIGRAIAAENGRGRRLRRGGQNGGESPHGRLRAKPEAGGDDWQGERRESSQKTGCEPDTERRAAKRRKQRRKAQYGGQQARKGGRVVVSGRGKEGKDDARGLEVIRQRPMRAGPAGASIAAAEACKDGAAGTRPLSMFALEVNYLNYSLRV